MDSPGKKNLSELVHKLRYKYTDAWGCHNDCYDPEWCFDMICDVSHFQSPTGTTVHHLGHHCDILEPMIDSSGLDALFTDFRYQYALLGANHDIVKVLVVCPLGNIRSVACAEILKHVLHRSGKLVDKELHHISTDNWGPHRNSCDCCKHLYRQARFLEVVEKAVKPQKREVRSEAVH